VAESARVLTYDRAGLSGSQAGPLPRTSLQIARELKALLDVVGLHPPLILVAHSAGGWHVRGFATEYPDLVGGLLLIDSPHEEFEERRNATLDARERQERETMLREMRGRLPEGHRREYEGLDANSLVMWARPLPVVPLIVLSAGQHEWRPADKAVAHEEAWLDGQRKLARLSPKGQLEIVEGSSHNIHLDRPEAVIRAIEHLIVQLGGTQSRKSGANATAALSPECGGKLQRCSRADAQSSLEELSMDQSHASKIKAATAAIVAGRQLDAVDEFFAPEYVVHGTDRDLAGGAAWVRRFVGMLHEAFSDLEAEVEILVESGDRVAWQRTLSGTQNGPFMGFPPSNRRVVWRDMATSRFQDGRIAEDWVITDLAERLLLARKSMK
jgi:predicted ester cyclase